MTIVLALAAGSMAVARADGPSFTDVTAPSGLHFALDGAGTPPGHILETKGGGLVLIDFDSDGDRDIFIPNVARVPAREGSGARLFENLGGLRFRDVTAQSGIEHRRWSLGCAVGDVDADGREDILIGCLGPDVLLHNEGGGRFADWTERAGLGQDDDASASVALADLDGDGDLDLFVANYVRFDPAAPPGRSTFRGIEVMAGPRGLPAEPDRLHENLGGGRFVDRSSESGIAALAPGWGLNAAIVDFTGDGRPDILVGNDSNPDQLLENLGALRFRDIGRRSGIATSLDGTEQATMGIAVGDVDGNARPDAFVTVFSSDTNTLHLNRNGRTFDDRSAQFGVAAPSRTSCGWATALIDLDHDRDEDIVVFNGHAYPQATKATMDSDFAQPPLVLLRDGQRFLPAPGAPLGAAPHVDRSAVFDDLDADGDIDIIVAGLDGPLRVLRNDHDRPDDWVEVELRDERPGGGNRAGIGARIEFEQEGLVQRRWLVGGGPFQSNASPMAHFGALSARAGTVRVTWPDGGTQSVEGVQPGSRLTVRRDQAAPVKAAD